MGKGNVTDRTREKAFGYGTLALISVICKEKIKNSNVAEITAGKEGQHNRTCRVALKEAQSRGRVFIQITKRGHVETVRRTEGAASRGHQTEKDGCIP